MKLYCKDKNFKLYEGSMLDMLDVIEPASIDSIITDPPYELGFMSKSWDSSGIAFQPETWAKCLSVLKSGGYLLAFGGSRTFHRIACAIEDAGFEIRDVIMWLYGSGFPKSMNIGLAIDRKNGIESEVIGMQKSGTTSNALFSEDSFSTAGQYELKKARNEWDGWGTALKPAYEPIIVARKPCESSCVDNVLKYGTGGLNIKDCKIGDDIVKTQGKKKTDTFFGMLGECEESEHLGRYPSNVILTYDDTDKNEVCSGMPSDANGSASRYFYCAKASTKDRDEGLEKFKAEKRTDEHLRANAETARIFGANSAPTKNVHPTVKPTELMQYLVRLVNPKGATILDCFNGSGSTGKAVMLENVEREREYQYIGIELTPEYLPIAEARIRWAQNYKGESFEQANPAQVTMFDLL